jgi:hypothetical protein
MLAFRMWSQFYDRQPAGDPKDTLRALLREIELMRAQSELNKAH